MNSCAIAIGVLLCLAAPAPAGQSLDCRKAATSVEKMICADPELSKLDQEMAHTFADARNNLHPHAAGQAAWLRDVRNRCASADCLQAAYRERIGGFSGLEELAGEWTRFGDTKYTGAFLTIEDVTAAGFTFDLSTSNGSHSGQIEGAAVRNGSTAVYRDDEWKCDVRFSRKGDRLVIAVSDGCRAMGGMGVTFNGEFGKGEVPRRTVTLTELGVLAPKVTEQAFAAVAGDAYKLFTQSFDMYSVEDGPGGARFATGGVRGMWNEIGAIVISRPDGKIIAAVIDDDVVRYFSNDPEFKTKLHPAIEEWRAPFADRKVVFGMAK